MVNGQLESVFEVAEELSELRRAGVEWEAFCPEDCTASEVVLQVFREFIAISRSWYSKDMRRYSNADKGGSCGNELRGDSWCDEVEWYQLLPLGGSWFGRCWSARLLWCLNSASNRARCMGSVWVLGGEGGKGLTEGGLRVSYVSGRQFIKCGCWGRGCGRDRMCGVSGFRGGCSCRVR